MATGVMVGMRYTHTDRPIPIVPVLIVTNPMSCDCNTSVRNDDAPYTACVYCLDITLDLGHEITGIY